MRFLPSDGWAVGLAPAVEGLNLGVGVLLIARRLEVNCIHDFLVFRIARLALSRG